MEDRPRRIRLWREIAPDLSQMDDRGHAAVAHLLAAQGKDSTAGLLARHAARPRVARGAGAGRVGGVTLHQPPSLLGGLSGGIGAVTLRLFGGGGALSPVRIAGLPAWG